MIVEHHGGQILIESAVGQGTTVTLRLPYAAHAGETGPPGERAQTERS